LSTLFLFPIFARSLSEHGKQCVVLYYRVHWEAHVALVCCCTGYNESLYHYALSSQQKLKRGTAVQFMQSHSLRLFYLPWMSFVHSLEETCCSAIGNLWMYNPKPPLCSTTALSLRWL